MLNDRARVLAQASPIAEVDYYAVTLIARDERFADWSTISHWEGYHDIERRYEIRRASLIRAEIVVNTFRVNMKQSCLVIDREEDLLIFYLVGGNALIRKEIAEAHLPDVLSPVPTARIGETGYEALSNLSPDALQKAPSKRARMEVLKRDEFRCRLCGRRASDNTDITLHVHHIRPWKSGGVTHADNLMTLCHTCHEGLDPHYEISLYNLMPGKTESSYWRQLKLHQEIIRRVLYGTA